MVVGPAVLVRYGNSRRGRQNVGFGQKIEWENGWVTGKRTWMYVSERCRIFCGYMACINWYNTHRPFLSAKALDYKLIFFARNRTAKRIRKNIQYFSVWTLLFLCFAYCMLYANNQDTYLWCQRICFAVFIGDIFCASLCVWIDFAKAIGDRYATMQLLCSSHFPICLLIY